MLASALDAQGPGSSGGGVAARRRWGLGRSLDTLLVRLLGRSVDMARGGWAVACGGGRRRGSRRLGSPVARARFAGRARIPGRVRVLERDLGAVVDRGRPLLVVHEPRVGVCGLRGRRPRSGAVRAAVGLHPGRGARAAARVGAAREGDSRTGWVRARGAAQLSDRVLERARPPVRDGAAACPVARGAALAPALAPRLRGGLRLRARRRAAADLLARRSAGGRGCGGAVARPGVAAGGERGGDLARRRGGPGGCRVGVLATRAC